MTFKRQSKQGKNINPARHAEQAKRTNSNRLGNSGSGPSADRTLIAPLSDAQESIWFMDALNPQGGIYNNAAAYHLEGHLDYSALQAALQDIITRHASYRTHFEVQDGQPVQVIRPQASLDIHLIDISEQKPGDQETAISRILAEEPKVPFDTTQAPLMRVTLIRQSGNAHVLLIVTHHIITDDWSAGVFNRELELFYKEHREGEPEKPVPLPYQYTDYVARQEERLQGKHLQTLVDYWQTKLSDAQPLELPTDRPRPPAQNFEGSSITFEIPADLTSALRALGRQQNATLFMTCLAGLVTLLHRYSSQADILIGTSMANRNQRQMEGLIGYLVNTVVLRNVLTPGQSFEDILKSVRVNTLEALTHQELSLERLVKEIHVERDLSRNPLFQVSFVYHNAPFDKLRLQDLACARLQFPTLAARVDLMLVMEEEGDSIKGELIFSTDLWDTNSIQRMIGHYLNLLRGAVADPGAPVNRYNLLSQEERFQILETWNETECAFPSNRCLHDLFKEQAMKDPQRIAVIDGDRKETYGSLDERSDRLAARLGENEIQPDDRVVVYMDRSLDLIMVEYAILKAGGAFVPIDPKQPPQRVAAMLLDCAPRVVFTRREFKGQLPAVDCPILCLEDVEAPAAGTQTFLKASPSGPSNLAYVIYTSGSTGKPKGVMIEHASILNTIFSWQHMFAISPTDIMAANASPGFDASVWEIYGTLSFGGTLVIMPDQIRMSPRMLWQWLADHKVSILWLITSLAQLALEEELPPELALRFLAVGGEAMVITPGRKLPFKLFNLYGPTEVSVWATMASIDPVSSQPPPIGRPIDNCRIYILDADHIPLPIGIPGEICIAGAGLARGYLNDPSLTQNKFIPNPFTALAGERLYLSGDLGRYRTDGQIEFLGRKDHQVKIRGYRVDLGEIESTLQTYPGIREAVVGLKKDPSGTASLIAYLIPDDGCKLDFHELRATLTDQLPDYMLPASFQVMDSFPLTASGKVNREALPNLAASARDQALSERRLPQTKLEKQLAKIWERVLGINQAGLDDDFFELGGHSLLALRLIGQIREQTGLDLPLEAVFQAPTIARLANHLERRTPATSWSPLVTIQSKGRKTPFFCISPSVIDVVTYSNLARHLDRGQPFHALYVRAGRPAPGRTDDGLDTLDRFIREIHKVQPDGPYLLGGYSAGGKLAVQMAERMRMQGDTVRLVVLFDSFAPGYPQLRPFITPRSYQVLRVLRRIESYLWKFWVLDWRGKLDLASSRQMPLAQRLRTWVTNRYRELKKPLPQDDLGRVDPSLVQKNQLTRPYEGDITLIRAKKGLPGVRPDRTLGWGNWCRGRLQVIETPGDHEAILFGPRIPNVAAILQRCLDQASNDT